jgi:imidazole glycerol-phosphate synthase subunit HisH
MVMIIDYGMGNLFSIRNACQHVGIDIKICADRDELKTADAVILPGVGAFGDAMSNLDSLDLIEPLREYAAAGRPMIGICLGMQLFMSESEEFGLHQGLNLLPGRVIRFADPLGKQGTLKVPQVGWNRICNPTSAITMNGISKTDRNGAWQSTPLEGLQTGMYMYFVHSYYVKPDDPALTLSQSEYGKITFCSSILKDNIFACQFHPERSGENGLKIYLNLVSFIRTYSKARG